MQSQASYHSASSSPLGRRPSSGFDFDNEEADVRANVAVADGHVDIRSSAVKLDDNHDDADEGHFYDTLSDILGASSRVSTCLDLDLAFGTVDSNVNPASISLSTLPPVPSPRLSSSFCCCWGAHLRSRSLHCHNHLFPLLVIVL